MDEALSELIIVLKRHFGSYPLMRPQDAVKLIYQNEFGGGHLITDRPACFEYLQSEYARVNASNESCFARSYATEDIGNGLVRVNLHELDTRRLPLEKLCDAFILSAGQVKGDVQSFKLKLELLRSLDTPFDGRELSEFLASYIERGCPMLSHSEEYRAAYRPAYRVVLKSLIEQ